MRPSALSSGQISVKKWLPEIDSKSRHSLTCHGFTLIELLIVISVVLVLAGLLFPVTKTMWLRAQGAQCINNLRQWGVVFNTYIYDHNGTFPPAAPFNDGKSWQHPLAPLSRDIASANIPNWQLGKGILGCPAHSNEPWSLGMTRRYYSYVYNYNLDSISKFTVTRQSQVIVLADAINSGSPVTIFSQNNGQEKRVGFVHNGKYNALYVDAHVGSSDSLDIAENIIPEHGIY
jgi:prepilin-type N-terminal cleavage/methylation domain-containing protein/prepilin-type processing-associated H-X9-DG protein